jgi:hypothetical protein
MSAPAAEPWADALAALETALAEKLGAAAASLLAQGIDALVASLREAPLSERVVRHAFEIANGVLTDNPTFPPEVQRDLVVEGIRVLMRNLHATPLDLGGMTVQQLAMLALAQAGYQGPGLPA